MPTLTLLRCLCFALLWSCGVHAAGAEPPCDNDDAVPANLDRVVGRLEQHLPSAPHSVAGAVGNDWLRIDNPGNGPGADGYINDRFGNAVAVEGDTAVVGARGDDIAASALSGSVQVFTRIGSVWQLSQKLVAGPLHPQAEGLGNGVALSGDTMVAVTDGRPDLGSIFVYQRDAGLWALAATLRTATGGPVIWTTSVALHGDTLVVGSTSSAFSGGNGLAFVFERSNSVWSLVATLDAGEPGGSQYFGKSVAISDSTIIVGAPGERDHGAVHVFTRTGATWQRQQRLDVADTDPFADFGRFLAISGDTLAGAGSGHFAYVFERVGSTWLRQQRLAPADPTVGATPALGENFGWTLAVHGDVIVAGDPATYEGPNQSGLVRVFVRDGNSWSLQQQLFAPDRAADDYLSSAIAFDGQTILAGSPQDDVTTNLDQGSAHAFVRTGNAWTHGQRLDAGNGGADDHFGHAVALEGDVAIVGVPGDNIPPACEQGSAWILLRNGAGWRVHQQLVVPDGRHGDAFGASVAIADGIVAVGSPGFDSGGGVGFDEGAIYIFERDGTAWAQTRRLVHSQGVPAERIGVSLALSDSVLVAGGNHAAIAFPRDGPTWSASQRLMPAGIAADSWFGASVAASLDTVMVGAPGDDISSSVDQGSVVEFGRAGGNWGQRQKLTATDGLASDRFGHSLSLSGQRALVGSWRPGVPGLEPSQGGAYVFSRTNGVWAQEQKLTQVGERLGFAVALAGNVAVVSAATHQYLENSPDGNVDLFVSYGGNWRRTQRLSRTLVNSFGGFGHALALSGTTLLISDPSEAAAGEYSNRLTGAAFLWADPALPDRLFFDGFDPPLPPL